MNSNIEKFNDIINLDNFGIATLQRLFKWSFPKAKSIMEDLINYGAVIKLDKGYKVISAEKFKKLGLQIFLYSKYENLSKSLSNMIFEELVEDDRFMDKVNDTFKLNLDICNMAKKQRQENINILLTNTARRFILEKLAIDFIGELYINYALYLLDEYWLDKAKDMHILDINNTTNFPL